PPPPHYSVAFPPRRSSDLGWRSRARPPARRHARSGSVPAQRRGRATGISPADPPSAWCCSVRAGCSLLVGCALAGSALGALGGRGRRGVLGLGSALRSALGLLHHGLLRGVLLGDQLDDGHRGVVALAGTDLGDPGVAAGTLGEGRRDLLEERVDDALVAD